MSDSYHAIFMHYVWSTHHRVASLSPRIRERLFPYMGGIARNLDCSLIAAGGVDDHVHLLVKLHPSRATAEVARIIKCNSSGWIHDTFADQSDFAWQGGYAAFSVSKSATVVVERYIINQEQHHARRSFIDELKHFLTKHGVDFRPEHLD